jgi:hypothetical protein
MVPRELDMEMYFTSLTRFSLLLLLIFHEERLFHTLRRRFVLFHHQWFPIGRAALSLSFSIGLTISAQAIS